MSPRAIHGSLAGIALLGVATFAGAGDAPLSVLAKLARTGELFCQPALPVFCGNLHVSCAGRTRIETFAFTLKATQAGGMIESVAGTESLRTAFENAHTEWDSAGAYVILFARHGAGYIKLQSDGSYSFRYYAPQGGVMSMGRCD